MLPATAADGPLPTPARTRLCGARSGRQRGRRQTALSRGAGALVQNSAPPVGFRGLDKKKMSSKVSSGAGHVLLRPGEI